MRRSPHLRAALAAEGGFTLAELLVASLVGIVVVGGAVALFSSGIRSQASIQSRAAQIAQARTALERIVREIRQGWSATVDASGSQLTLLTYVDSASCGGAKAATAIRCQVTYSCTPSGATAFCTRTERNPDGSGGGTPVTIVTGLASPAIFSPPGGSVSYVDVTMDLAVAGHAAVTVGDGASLSNPAGA